MRPRNWHVTEMMTDNLAQIVLRHSYPQITCDVVVDLPVERQIALAARLKLHTKLKISAVESASCLPPELLEQFHVGLNSFGIVHAKLIHVKLRDLCDVSTNAKAYDAV